MRTSVIQLIIVVLILSSCQKEKEISRGIYYWRSNFETTSQELQELSKLKINTLYLHLFDVKMINGKAVPVATIRFKSDIPDSLHIIPVIYITNETMLQLQKSELSELAIKIKKLSHQLLGNYFLSVKEFQFDCDWTDKSKENYFYFLRYYSNLENETIPLSATIRLHQVKYQNRTGIPPVSRGMLMFYNMGNIRDYQSNNSIYNSQTAESYLTNGLKYPIPLDVSLAAYSWGILYRYGIATELLSNLSKEELVRDSLILNSHSNFYKIRKEHLFHGVYLQAGDEIRLEAIDAKQLQQAAKQLSNRWNNEKFTLTLYHWHDYLFNTFNSEELEITFSTFN